LILLGVPPLGGYNYGISRVVNSLLTTYLLNTLSENGDGRYVFHDLILVLNVNRW